MNNSRSRYQKSSPSALNTASLALLQPKCKGSGCCEQSQTKPYTSHVYLDKTAIQKDTCTTMFTAALFTIARS